MLLNDFFISLCIAPCLPQEEAILSRWELNVENEINVLNLNLLSEKKNTSKETSLTRKQKTSAETSVDIRQNIHAETF
jgi:hypothetical protein